MSNTESDAAHAVARANEQRHLLRQEDGRSAHTSRTYIDRPADEAGFVEKVLEAFESNDGVELIPGEPWHYPDRTFTPMWAYVARSDLGIAIERAFAEGRITKSYHDVLVDRIVEASENSDTIIREALAAFPDNALLSPVIRSAARHSTGKKSPWPLLSVPDLTEEQMEELESLGFDADAVKRAVTVFKLSAHDAIVESVQS
ncbi:hypothetical protein [Herbiconiux sp. VKM Ac-2851]|uniref:hypothetical protein n=1 Tax=Herbiconiux sp. VKM Ac-2851 TaxID=2739025 RepID=UPI001563A476|nr:hypothetical protein [Herbiconiux sp. VKM Ac-2851]NQX36281.1 hypothetical protein [Herbiconiux sp. VKM Ac-2851]